VIRELASGRERALLFTRTKHGAKKLAKQLTMAGIPAVELHGNLSQNARERNLESFSDGSTKVLVATDIAARGIHVDDIALVVHVDPPAEHKAYLHRSGRTARAGAEGVVITIMTPDQVGDVKSLARAAKIEPLITRVSPGHQVITSLVGAPAALEHRAIPQPRPQGPGKGPRNGGSKGGPKGLGARPAGRNAAPKPANGGARPHGRGGSGAPKAGTGASRGARTRAR
jgi:superfamily II DNA/RNA helicase